MLMLNLFPEPAVGVIKWLKCSTVEKTPKNQLIHKRYMRNVISPGRQCLKKALKCGGGGVPCLLYFQPCYICS